MASGKRKPSDKLNPKTTDMFNDQARARSNFGTLYANGNIPCRLNHGSVKHKLEWTCDIADVNFNPILIMLAEGLKEQKHPYTFLAQTGFKELLELPDAKKEAFPLVTTIVPHLKVALMNDKTFEAGLRALTQFVSVVEEGINPHLKTILPPLSKKLSKPAYKEAIYELIQMFEQFGGTDALKIIKARIPTYTSIVF